MENLDENNKNESFSLVADYGTSDSESVSDTETPAIDNAESEDGELSEMVKKNNIINACAHGPLASRVLDEETTRHMIIESAEDGVLDYEVTEYRDADDSSSDSDSSDSDVDSVKDVEELSSSDETGTNNKPEKLEPPKVQGELGLDDLPPIEDLAISLPSQETTKIGTVASIVDRLVVVRALPHTPAVDLDSVLFLENGAKALGKVFDVFGQVTEPHYCVRFNSPEHVRERGVQPGMEVFIAPKSEQHTNYVLISQLMKLKGSDASWMDDTEPPPSHVEYSDDEEERRARRGDRGGGGEERGGEGEERPGRRGGEARRGQRPADRSSRFGSGPSRGRNPFSQRRPPNSYPRGPAPLGRGWPAPPPMFPPPFNPTVPPPLMSFRFGGAPRMPQFAPGAVFGPIFCTASGPPPHWANAAPPPPPGT